MAKKIIKQTRASVSKKKLLLIEDDTFLSGMYLAKLTMENFDVKLAVDGEEGLALARSFKPDIILLDLLLPKIDGYTVLKKLKSSRSLSAIPVILLTNLNQQTDIDKALKYHVEDYLIKAHFMPSEVIEKIKKILRK